MTGQKNIVYCLYLESFTACLVVSVKCSDVQLILQNTSYNLATEFFPYKLLCTMYYAVIRSYCDLNDFGMIVVLSIEF